jgi:Phage late-transcription coactivator
MNDEIDVSQFLTKKTLSAAIESKVLENPGMTYFDAMLQFCDEADKDPDEMLQFMDTVMIQKLQKSAIDTGLFQSNTYELDELVEDDTQERI